MLVIMCGLPGTGKSTLAREVARRVGAMHISSDSMRMKMLRERTYSEKEKEKIYDAMFEEAEKLLAAGKNVMLDATFYKKKLRQKAKRIAAKSGSTLFIVECVTHEELLKERIFARKKRRSESEADFGVYKKVKRVFEPIKEEHLAVDTSPPLERQVELVLDYLYERR